MKQKINIRLIILIVFRLLFIVAIGVSIYEGKWFNLFICVLAFGLTFLPLLIEKRYNVNYPDWFEIAIVFFIYASMILGDINSFYFKFWWWDKFLHLISAIILGLLSYSLIYALNKGKMISLKPSFIALFAFCFALSSGAIWEIFEFSCDYFLKTNMQRSSLFDTMTDIVVDTLGALFISLIGFFYDKGHFKFLKFLQDEFKDKNPEIFENK